MREISAEQLREILSEHQFWLHTGGGDKGKRANLRGVDLRRTNLQRANLRGADLREVDPQLLGANFSHKLFRLFLIKTQIIHTHITFKLISFCKRVVSHANITLKPLIL
jgi:uncharacterized protein YjbI with pentapeptide repeats